MQTIVWEVECLSCVKMRRYCKKCGVKTDFVSSGRFRVNANKKKLDVWLVYRCDVCGASWNLPVHERVNPSSLPKATLEGYLKNNPALARQYTMDAALLVRHGCEVRPPEIVVTGKDVPEGRPVQLVLQSAVPLPLRLDKLLRQKLGLSAKALEALLESGGIRLASGQDVRRQKLGRRAHLVVRLPVQTAANDDEPPRPISQNTKATLRLRQGATRWLRRRAKMRLSCALCWPA